MVSYYLATWTFKTLLTQNRAIQDPIVIEVAERLGKTPAQVVLSWIVQRGIVALTKSVTPSRIKSNLEGEGLQTQNLLVYFTHMYAVFELPSDAFEKVASLDRNHRYNLPARLGVDIFGDAKPGVLEKAVENFKAQNKKARGL